MPNKPHALKENEYTIKKLIERVGGNKNTWRKYLRLEEFKNDITTIEKRINLFKFTLNISELDFKQKFIQYRDNMASKKIINAKIASGNMPIKQRKSV